MKSRAQELAKNMTESWITPGNEKQHPAYNATYDTLSYSHDVGTPLSHKPYGPCTLQRHNGQWVMFDEHGAAFIPIVWDGNAWRAGEKTTC